MTDTTEAHASGTSRPPPLELQSSVLETLSQLARAPEQMAHLSEQLELEQQEHRRQQQALVELITSEREAQRRETRALLDVLDRERVYAMDAAPSVASSPAPPPPGAAPHPPGPPPPPPLFSQSSQRPSASPSASLSMSGRKRRNASTELRDLAIFRAAATLRAQHAPWGQVKKTWQAVAASAATETGDPNVPTGMFCQRRYEALVERFLARRETRTDWPPNPELRALLESAAADQKTRDAASSSSSANPAANVALPPHRMLHELKASIRRAGGDIKEETKTATEPLEDGEERDEAHGHSDSTSLREHESDEMGASGVVSAGRRSFVESTLVAVLDRLARFESKWLENEREERAWKRQRMELECEALAVEEEDAEQHGQQEKEQEEEEEVEEEQEGEEDEKDETPAPIAPETAPIVTTATLQTSDRPVTMPLPHADAVEASAVSTDVSKDAQSDPHPGTAAAIDQTSQAPVAPRDTTATPSGSVSTREFEELQRTVAELTTSLTANTQDQLQLNQQAAGLATALTDVRQETDVLKRDVATLQALLRDAASLAGTLRTLRDAHHQHEAHFDKFVHQQDARLAALEHEVKERHELVVGQLNGATSVEPSEELLASLQRERDVLQADHRERLAQLDAKMAELDAPVNELKAAIKRQEQRLQHHELTEETTRDQVASVAHRVKELRAALERERADRDNEYGTLLKTIEQVVAGQADLP